MKRYYITLGGGRRVTVASYTATVRHAIKHPGAIFARGLCSEWRTSGAEIRAEFREMVTGRCNRGLTIGGRREAWSYVSKRIKAGRLPRVCPWCGAIFHPTAINHKFCSDLCRRSYES